MKKSMLKPKKRFGQHFLQDEGTAERIVQALQLGTETHTVLEIGPGTGVLTQFLFQHAGIKLYAIEVDRGLFHSLQERYPSKKDRIIEGDVLKWNWHSVGSKIDIIGNFPYGISTQILFKVLDEYHRVDQVVCMLQKEVAARVASQPGNKTYGVLSVLLQAYYDVEFLFEVPPEVFFPIPKITSAVIRLKRNTKERLNCDAFWFRQVVKQGFQNRRKTLRNALKGLNLSASALAVKLLDRRAEQLSVDDFVRLAQECEKKNNGIG